jgi:hypothetical protein
MTFKSVPQELAGVGVVMLIIAIFVALFLAFIAY